jgi:hypothetical protein
MLLYGVLLNYLSSRINLDLFIFPEADKKELFICCLYQWYRIIFYSRTPRCNLSSTVYPQSCCYIIQVMQYIIYI